ncbi:MAG: acetate--CoA ligase family protein [Bacteroidales bacterium]
MINRQLLDPKSIVVIGGSNETYKPGGKVIKNLISGGYKGMLYAVNPKESEVQGIKCYKNTSDLPETELAIIAIPARFCLDVVETLATKKNTRAFIILSAEFSEQGHEGKILEDKIVSVIDKAGGVLIGPNGIGVITPNYSGVFTEPLPNIDPKGVDLISGSGATAVFILETGISRGLTFANVFSVGNSAQTGVEDILKFMDENFDPETSAGIKLLYLENIQKPDLLLKHASSLVRKGCKIAAVKAGSSDAGSRAASSHTGALASSDLAVDALFKKAGIIRCAGRDELVTVACVLKHPLAKGKNFAIITHAGGPAVMLTDTLSKNGLNVPLINNEYSGFLLNELNPGSSVSNPIDFLATGTALQLGIILEYVIKKFDEIDAIIVIFGTPGLFKVFDVYEVLHGKMLNSKKPIYPVLPSVMVAADEIKSFLAKGHVFFPDEVLLGEALGKVYNFNKQEDRDKEFKIIDTGRIKQILNRVTPGFQSPDIVQELLDACNIPRVEEFLAGKVGDAVKIVKKINYPVAIKVVGPIHKSDVGGVCLNIDSDDKLFEVFKELMEIPGATSVLIQPMLSGLELFIGAKAEKPFGHLVLCGLGGIFIEILNDFSASLVPVSEGNAHQMIKSLKAYKIIAGARGKEPVNEDLFAEIIVKISELLKIAPQISELDLNPLIAWQNKIVVVDARIKIG